MSTNLLEETAPTVNDTVDEAAMATAGEARASDGEDAPDDAFTRTVATAADRVNYRLTFAVTDPRETHEFGIAGPQIPNAYEPEKLSSGDWDDPDFTLVVATEQEAIERWFMTAVREATHEALEWYRVDGDVFLDPHGEHENAIHTLSEKFATDLLALRTQTRLSS